MAQKQVKFYFTSRDQAGNLIKGSARGDSELDIRSRLREAGHSPISIKSTERTGGFDLFAKAVTPKEFQIFLRQLSVLLKSGVPLLESLVSLEESAISPALSRVLKFLIEDIKEGKTLSDAMKRHPKVFESMVVNLVKAGEHGGILDDVLDRLGTFFEKRKKLKSKVVGALMYPAVTIAVAIVALTAILVFVIPKFEKLFQSNGGDLPAMTQMVVNMSHGFRDYWYVIAAVTVGLPIAVSYLYKAGPFRRPIDQILLKLPLFGSLVKRGAVARMSRTVSTLLKSGIRIHEALNITIGTMGNVVVDEHMAVAREEIMAGKPLTEPLRKSGFFPVIVIQMISIGEQTGSLDSMLEKVADFYEDEVETTAEQLTSLLEPVVIVVLGGMIGFLVVSMFLPIFNLGNTF